MTEVLHMPSEQDMEAEHGTIPPHIYDEVLGRIAMYPGVIDYTTLATAIKQGMYYGNTLEEGRKPQTTTVEEMARDICGLNSKPPRSIGDEPFLQVTIAIDRAARMVR